MPVETRVWLINKDFQTKITILSIIEIISQVKSSVQAILELLRIKIADCYG
jgi:hypothetical protein